MPLITEKERMKGTKSDGEQNKTDNHCQLTTRDKISPHHNMQDHSTAASQDKHHTVAMPKKDFNSSSASSNDATAERSARSSSSHSSSASPENGICCNDAKILNGNVNHSCENGFTNHSDNVSNGVNGCVNDQSLNTPSNRASNSGDKTEQITNPNVLSSFTTTSTKLFSPSVDHSNVVTNSVNYKSHNIHYPEMPKTDKHAPSVGQCSPSLELTIPRFYAGKYIFITGATGFIGKVLVEKLMRSCPDLGGIYCLIRPKNDQTVEDRLADLVDSKLFDTLRKEQPDFCSKLHPVAGDVLQPQLGLSPQDYNTLVEHVNVVFHSAATVRFNEPLRVAVEMNLIAVRKMLNLSRKLKHLQAFVHVSTAYANCDKSYIEERVYPPPVEPQKIIDVLSWMDDEMVNLFTPKLIGEKPNTYTYTKQLAEHLVITEGADLPIAIVRPSIVGAAWKEPFPGWIDNYNGPSGIYIAAGKGILRWMKADTNAVADIVPVDIPINILIAVGWYTAVAKPKNIYIYHATTGNINPFRWGEMEVVVNKSFTEIPLEKCFRRPNVAIVNNTFADYWKYVSHMFPAYICDMALSLVGKKPKMVKMYNRLHNSINSLSFFTCNEWQWETHNLEVLRHHLTPEDMKTFYFDLRPLHWPTYIENYCLGAKKYLLNEDLSGLPAARAHIRNLRIIRTLFNSAIGVILWRVLIAKSQFARNLWFFIVSLVFKFVRFFRITSTMHK